MEGIQLLAAPSRNLKPDSPRTAQNAGTSGRDTRRPARAKMLAIHRIASLFSFGTNNSRIAPTSGVNRMIERMWLDIVLSFSASSQERRVASEGPDAVLVVHCATLMARSSQRYT